MYNKHFLNTSCIQARCPTASIVPVYSRYFKIVHLGHIKVTKRLSLRQGVYDPVRKVDMPASNSIQTEISTSPCLPYIGGPESLENFFLEWSPRINWETFPKIHQRTCPSKRRVYRATVSPSFTAPFSLKPALCGGSGPGLGFGGRPEDHPLDRGPWVLRLGYFLWKGSSFCLPMGSGCKSRGCTHTAVGARLTASIVRWAVHRIAWRVLQLFECRALTVLISHIPPVYSVAFCLYRR